MNVANASSAVINPFEGPSVLGAVKVPGIPALAANMERYVVPPIGSRLINLEAGDEVTLLDKDGLQPCEFVAWSADGRIDSGLLGAQATGPASGLCAILGMPEHSAIRSREALSRAGIDLGHAQATRVFDEGSRAGERVTLTAASDASILVGAPPASQDAGIYVPASPIVVYVRRARGARHTSLLEAPAPLADPLADMNIAPGTAVAFEVKAGQYVQILDVKGRECSDFQAFSLRALDRGLERDIDPTTTRSLMGSLYPAPGLFSKYYSLDQEPLIEIMQDTCGRHDTFGLACTARYYEDLGYPGHLNCSENMNNAGEPFGIARRGGWPAINFFFNTTLDDTNALGMDDPWSRPGDYVLLRALTDLVCVSTACPCDIDPANGWHPTDIQTRVYDAKEDFKRGVGFRMSTQSEAELTKETGFHDSFAKHTRNFVEYNGYWLPQDFPNHGSLAEYWACREKAVVMDLSPLRKYEILGPDAEALMQRCVTRNMKKLSVGQVVYTAMCYEHGGMIDDGTVLRLGDNNFRWVGGNDTSGLWLREQAEALGLNVWVKDSTSQMCNIAIQGPKSREILESIIWTAPTQPTVTELGWFRFSVARLNDFHGIPLVVSRTGYTGELGYEIFCHPKDASELFNAVWEAGEPHGLTPLGLGALDMIRIEAGLVFAGYEFSDQTDPYEAGIGFTVPIKSKEDDFIGRDALLRRKEHPVRQLVGLDLEGTEVPGNGDCVRIGKAQVGEITSAVRSPILGKVIALCRMDVTHSAIGTEVEVGQLDGHQKRIPAKVTRFAHFDPEKKRARGDYS
jgi:aminomethyltransferase